MSKVLGVSESGYYAWVKRPPSKRARENEKLLAQIKEVFEESRRTYGSPRIYQALLQQDVVYGRNRIARLMRLNKIQPKRQ